MKNARANGSRWIFWWEMTGCRKPCGCHNSDSASGKREIFAVYRNGGRDGVVGQSEDSAPRGAEFASGLLGDSAEAAESQSCRNRAGKKFAAVRERRGEGIMNRRLAMSLILGGTLAASAGLAQAQEAPALPPRGEMLRGGGPGRDFMPPPMGARVELLGFEGMRGGKVVTGAPFSGVAVTESMQTLGDVNHITRKTQSNIFRDSQGRVRKEVTLPGFAALAASSEPKSFVRLSAPWTKPNFSLPPDTKVAEQMSHPHRAMKGLMKDGALEEKWQAREQEEIPSGNLKKQDLGTLLGRGVNTRATRPPRTNPSAQL